MNDEILLMKNIVKVYPNGFMANKGIDFSVKRGEIHALLGENGAGKTTLMNILFGLESHEDGDIFIDGKKVEIHNPLEAIQNGIGMVHQHFKLVPSLTIAENVVLGLEPKKKMGVFDLEEAARITRETAEKYHMTRLPSKYYENSGVLNEPHPRRFQDNLKIHCVFNKILCLNMAFFYCKNILFMI